MSDKIENIPFQMDGAMGNKMQSTPLKLDDASIMIDNKFEDIPFKDDDEMVDNNLEDTPMKSEAAKDEPEFTITKMEDLLRPAPVKIHVKMPVKKRNQGDLLKQLHLDNI